MAVGLLVLGGGCRVSAGQQQPTSSKVHDVLTSGKGQFDLTVPPSREEAGLPSGESTVTYQPSDDATFEVGVDLPDGKRLDVDARLISFDALGQPDPASLPPTSMDIHCFSDSLDAGRDQLLALAETFKLDAADIAMWYEEAKQPRPVTAPPMPTSPWLTAQLGYLTLQVQGRFTPPVNASDAGQTQVHLLLTWPAVGTTTYPR
jgi:hypothetical protein